MIPNVNNRENQPIATLEMGCLGYALQGGVRPDKAAFEPLP